MIEGGENLSMLFDRGLDYIHNSFNTSEGVVNRQQPTLLYRGIVIEIDFTAIKPTTTAALVPPFSIYAKVIGLDESSEDPLSDYDRVYYPPLFPMHNLCIPEVGEEILIMKESPEATSKGYYIGRVNDSTPLNISYARDFVGINDPQTENNARFGFSFDVRELREKVSSLDPNSMPSVTYNNVSVPITYGDVVQQGRSKTYLRHSFNRNNKEGVLEQGIQLSGQSIGQSNRFDFTYNGAGVNPTVGIGIMGDTVKDGFGEPQVIGVIENENNLLPPNEIMKTSYDPSVGETSTKTIHFIDTSIKRLGNYTFQSDVGSAGQNNLEGYDKSMIVNMADEIYNISLKEVDSSLYRHVLGEKLVGQQKETYSLMEDILTVVSNFAQTTSVLLDAFLDHEHALPAIDLNIDEEVTFQDKYFEPAVFVPSKPQKIRIPGTPTNFALLPNYDEVTTETLSGGGSVPPGFAMPPAVEIQAIKQLQDSIANQDMSLLMDISGPGPPLSEGVGVPDGQATFADFFLAMDKLEKYPGITIPGTPATTVSVRMPPKMIKEPQEKTRPKRVPINFQAVVGGEENPRFTFPIQTASNTPGEEIEMGIKTGKVHTDLQETVMTIAQQQATIIRLSERITDFLSKNQFVN